MINAIVSVVLTVMVTIALSTYSRPAAAQTTTVSMTVVNTDHDLLGDRLLGGAAHFIVPLGGRFSMRFGVERSWGNSRRTGIACAGLVNPNDCRPEILRDDARLTAAVGGLGFRLFSRPQVTLTFNADGALALVQSGTRGLTSGKSLSASEALRGGEFGVNGSWAPRANLPLTLEVGVSKGELLPMINEQIADGYTPFANGFGVTRVRVGVGWRW